MAEWICGFAIAGAVSWIATKISKARAAAVTCPICCGELRYHKPYFMCDQCERLAGVRIEDRNYISR
jgi:hypothetical protein